MFVRVEFEDMIMIMIPIRTDEGKCVWWACEMFHVWVKKNDRLFPVRVRERWVGVSNGVALGAVMGVSVGGDLSAAWAVSEAVFK